jgi:hypothetical protein
MSMTYEPPAQSPEIDFSEDAVSSRSRRLRWAAAALALVLAAGTGIGFVVTGHTSPASSARTTATTSPYALNHDPAPSLAGAYSDDLVVAFRALYAYGNWASEHPAAGLVQNYDAPGSSAFIADGKNLTYLLVHNLHEPRDQRGYDGDVEYARVTLRPRPVLDPEGHAVFRAGHPAFDGGVVLAVLHFRADDLYSPTGQDIQFGQRAGYAAISFSLSQGGDGQWRFYQATELHPAGGPKSVEKSS